SRCPFGKATVEIGTEHFINLLADTFFIGDAAILAEEAAANPHHRVLLQKVLAEPDFIYKFAVIPKGTLTGVFMFTHLFPPISRRRSCKSVILSSFIMSLTNSVRSCGEPIVSKSN